MKTFVLAIESTLKIASLEKSGRVELRDAIISRQVQHPLGQGDILVIGTFPSTNMDYHLVAVNVTHMKISSFSQLQTAGVGCRQVNTEMFTAYNANDLAYPLQAKHDRQFLLLGRSYQVEDGPYLLERELIEELDAA